MLAHNRVLGQAEDTHMSTWMPQRIFYSVVSVGFGLNILTIIQIQIERQAGVTTFGTHIIYHDT